MEHTVGDGTGKHAAYASAPRGSEDDQARLLPFGQVMQGARRKAGGGGDRRRNRNVRAWCLLHESAEPAHRVVGVHAEGTGELRVDAVDVPVNGVCAGKQKWCASQSREHEAQSCGRNVLAERIDCGDDRLVHGPSIALVPLGSNGGANADRRPRACICGAKLVRDGPETPAQSARFGW
jgi:hypothetical protein